MAENISNLFDKYDGKRNEIIPILQDVQDEMGYLTPDSMQEMQDSSLGYMWSLSPY